MFRFRLLSFFVILPFLICFAEETKPAQTTAKPFLLSYTQARVDLGRDTIIYKQEKVIFGIDLKMNENWSARVGIDLINMNKPYLKPTVLIYQKEQWTIEGGIFHTSEMDFSLSQFWGNRFIDRVAADKWIAPSADLGARVTYRWNDFITTDVSLVSGNGYQLLLEKYHPKPAVRVVLTPLNTLKLGAYIATRHNKNFIETTFSGFAHMQIDGKWKATGEYFHQTNSRLTQGQKLNVASFYGTYRLLPWMELLGRYDFVKSNKLEASNESWHVIQDGQAIIGGLIFRCFPSMRIAVNYWNKRPPVKRIKKEDWLYFCLEFKY